MIFLRLVRPGAVCAGTSVRGERDTLGGVAMVCAVVFQPQGRLYYADPGTLSPQVGDRVLYPTAEGPEVAQVMWAPEWVSEEIGGLPVLEGMAEDADLETAEVSRKKRAAARVAARRLVREHE